jgi:hypothetical protein
MQSYRNKIPVPIHKKRKADSLSPENVLDDKLINSINESNGPRKKNFLHITNQTVNLTESNSVNLIENYSINMTEDFSE